MAAVCSGTKNTQAATGIVSTFLIILHARRTGPGGGGFEAADLDSPSQAGYRYVPLTVLTFRLSRHLADTMSSRLRPLRAGAHACMPSLKAYVCARPDACTSAWRPSGSPEYQ